MMGNMTLGNLIEWLNQQEPEIVVKDGFGSPHSDRGDYFKLAFDPIPEASIARMLIFARSALGATFLGYMGNVGRRLLPLRSSIGC